MPKKIIAVLLMMLLVAGMLTTAFAGTGDGLKIACVVKSAGNAFMEIAADAFRSAGESEGAEVEIVYPENATAQAQIKVLDELISRRPDAIAIAANDFDALQGELEEAMKLGIKVVAFDSAPKPVSRQVFVNQANVTAVARVLMNAVYDMAGGEGEYAILSATSQAANQNAWIAAMAEIAKSPQYAGLKLVEVTYGDDDPLKSTEQVQYLLDKYPKLKVICAPTTVGIAAAAKLLQDNDSAVKLTGLGLPSEMIEYTGEDKNCSYFYLWDMNLLGTLTAHTAIAMANGTITGAVGETFAPADLGEFTIIECSDGGTEIVQGLLLQFNAENIEEMAELY